MNDSLEAAVESIFAEEGVLARSEPAYQPRVGQMRMAAAVARTMARGGELVVEAGTGVGKTYAYLVPALLSGERVLLSTATKALQDQLFARDIPKLAALLQVPVKAALLKGRSSYLCKHRLNLARHSAGVEDRRFTRLLAKVEEWSHSTVAGDLAELATLDEQSPVIPLVTSTRDNCLGSQCPSFKDCHVNQARRKALASDVVVVNHHLFFADIAVRESGVAELLPTVRVVVFDEAHQLNDAGVQFLGTQLTSGQFIDFAQDALTAGLSYARGFADWPKLSSALQLASRQWRDQVAQAPGGTKVAWTREVPEGADPSWWPPALMRLAHCCTDLTRALDAFAQVSLDLSRLAERGAELLLRLGRFQAPAQDGCVRWLDAGSTLRLVESPLDIADAMQSKVLQTAREQVDEDGWPVASQGPGRSWIFTSATLGHDEALTWFTQHCGLQGAEVMRVDSPFSYVDQAGLYVPDEFPAPADPAHSLAVAALVAEAAEALGGRTLVLTTTLKALSAIGQALREALARRGSALEVLVQGEGGKRQLMERFRAAGQSSASGCVLVASASFWEGFDVPGQALQLVVIDKLPFPPPGDPLLDARSAKVQASGGKPFMECALPEAAVALKQGAGRLIRHESDRGVLVITDTRLVRMGYGKRLLAALPPMKRLEGKEAFHNALNALALLTRTSTTDRTWP